MTDNTPLPSKAKKKRYSYMYAVGRRKTSTARVRFYKNNEKTGRLVINEKAHTEYLTPVLVKIVEDPIKLIAAPLEGYFTVKVSGGGIHSQAEAVRHGIARILVKMNEDWRAALRKKGYLTRDSRMKERKKPGLKRARRAPQWSKR